MFTLFFTDREVIDYDSALRADTKLYAKFFKNMLEAGIMFPPSQFESVFVSLAHTKKEIDMALKAAYSALKEMR
jgi:Glutamate-1-semialdehyde aminotransferase